MFTNARI